MNVDRDVSMDKEIEKMRRELSQVESAIEEIGPIVVGTLSRSRKKYQTKDGKVHYCEDSAMLKLSGARSHATMRIPREREGAIRELIANGKKWMGLNKRLIELTSRLAALGALKKNCS